MICSNCANASATIPEELKDAYNELSMHYNTIYYCSKRQVLVVANVDVPTQEITECSDFSRGE